MNKEQLIEKIKEKLLTDSFGRRDICTIYRDNELMNIIIDELAAPYRGKVDYVAAPESLGFILGTYLSAALGVGFIPIRNGNIAVLQADDAIRASYIDHRDTARTLQVRKSNLPKDSKVLLVDDWVETGSTLHACRDILDEAGAKCVGIAAIGCNINERSKEMLEQGILFCIAQA
ncbi:MAG: phosphoribosyltransferase family protein [Eubacteriales bacterium]|nr:phosphoribosyltransferase family protein [Eubacteriales bacterium]